MRALSSTFVRPRPSVPKATKPHNGKWAAWRRWRSSSDRRSPSVRPGELELHADVEYVREHAHIAVRRARVYLCIYVCVVHLHSSYLLNVFIGSHKEKTAASCQPSLPFTAAEIDAMPVPHTASSFCLASFHVSNFE